jgi:hypothetical protein
VAAKELSSLLIIRKQNNAIHVLENNFRYWKSTYNIPLCQKKIMVEW